MNLTLEILYEIGIINSDVADKCKMQFSRCIIEFLSSFKTFKSSQGPDQFFTKLLSKYEQYQDF